MRWNSPIPRTGLPHFSEASSQRSVRDEDVVARQWLKNKDIGKQLAWLSNSVQQIQRYLERARLFKPTTSAGLAVSFYAIAEVHYDFLLCHPYDFASSSENSSVSVKIAKPQKLHCNITTETKQGTSHTYTYSSNVDGLGIDNMTRVDTPSGGSAENQQVRPPWIKHDIIYALPVGIPVYDDPIGYGSGTGLLLQLNYIQIGESRQWAKIS